METKKGTLTPQVDLATAKCQACTSATPTLDEETGKQLISQLDASWEIKGDRLVRRFTFANFAAAFAFAAHIALLAQEEGHHPDLSLGWGYCEIALMTHAIKGLSANDFILAAKIDQL